MTCTIKKRSPLHKCISVHIFSLSAEQGGEQGCSSWILSHPSQSQSPCAKFTDMTWGKLIVSHVLLHRSRITLGKQARALTPLKLSEKQMSSPPQATKISRITFLVWFHLPSNDHFLSSVPIFHQDKRLFSQYSFQELLDHKEPYRNGIGANVTKMHSFAREVPFYHWCQ